MEIVHQASIWHLSPFLSMFFLDTTYTFFFLIIQTIFFKVSLFICISLWSWWNCSLAAFYIVMVISNRHIVIFSVVHTLILFQQSTVQSLINSYHFSEWKANLHKGNSDKEEISGSSNFGVSVSELKNKMFYRHFSFNRHGKKGKENNV